MTSKQFIVVFLAAFVFAVIISAPVTFENRDLGFVDSVVSAFGDGGDGGGSDGGGGDGPGGGDGGGGDDGHGGGGFGDEGDGGGTDGCCDGGPDDGTSGGGDNPNDNDDPGGGGGDPDPRSCVMTASENPIMLGESTEITIHFSDGEIETFTVTPDETETFERTFNDQICNSYGCSHGAEFSCSIEIVVEELPPLECTLDIDKEIITVGDSADLSWTTNNADTAVIDHGIGSAIPDGNTTIFPPFTKTYTLTATRGNETVQCEDTIIVEEPKECMLRITKSVDKDTANVNDHLTYTLNFENVGNGDCSGGGVQIVDTIDTNLLFIGETHSGNVTAGYLDTPVFENGVLRWNGHTLTPGETGWVSWTGKVTEPNQCGPFTVYNQGKITAVELDYWVFSNTVDTDITHNCPEAPVCEHFFGTPSVVPHTGGDVTLDWSVINADTVEINNGIGFVNADDTIVRTVTADTTFILTATATGFDPITCEAPITVAEPEAPTCDLFTGDPTELPVGGGNVTLTWETTNAGTVEINNGVGVVAEDDSTIVSVADDLTYVLTVSKHGYDPVTCEVPITVADPDPITCEANVTFTATPDALGVGGGDVELGWSTTDVIGISINDGTNDLGVSDLTGTTSVNVTDDMVFTLSAEGVGGPIHCPVTVSVEDPTPDPISCEANVALTATPTNLGVGGGEVELTWSTTDIDDIKLNGIAQDLTGSATTSISETTTFNFEVTGDSSTTGNTEICPITVTVEDPAPLSCADHVNFSVSPDSVREGNNATLTWNTTDEITSVVINPDLGEVALDGSQEVTVDETTTYTLTASNGEESIQCPVTVTGTTGGGGGGGSSRPRCEFLVSDSSISSGEEITLSWETRRGRDLTIFEGDEDGEIIFETDDDDEVDEGEFRVRPTKDTTYTLLVERGSRDTDCTVKVNVKDDVVITSTRTQGQVAGISLTAVPYTGFEAGPMLTLFFYGMLALWGLFVAYMLVIREDSLLGVSLAGSFSENRVITDDISTEETDELPGESIAAQYVASATAAVAAPIATSQVQKSAPVATAPSVPANLPTGEFTPVVGYAAAQTAEGETETVVANTDETADELKELEDRAHERKVLLSSDAMRHLISVCPRDVRRVVFLDQVIQEAKVSYPSEDGWVVLNLDRMTEICDKRKNAAPAVELATQSTVAVAPEKKIADIPNGVGSLAESIVSGNIAAAYQMIGNRPMIALADAAADLDAVYRARKGEEVAISDMLTRDTAKLPTEKIEEAINALTSAIDGTYTDEAGAVKMAILKACKALS